MRPSTASLMSLGSLKTRMLSAKRARAYSDVCSRPGMTVARTRGRAASSGRARPARSGGAGCRRARCAATRRAGLQACAGRPAALASDLRCQSPVSSSRMSSSVGVWWPFSILETLEAGHDNDSASCLPLSPARSRSSRSRLPSAIACFVDVGDTRGRVRWQSRPVVRRDARRHPASSCARTISAGSSMTSPPRNSSWSSKCIRTSLDESNSQ